MSIQVSKRPTSKPILHFDRFEFKYLLNQATREEFESSLQHFMDLDPFVLKQEHSRYFVRSLYFDDPFYTCFNDKIDGVKKRHKFRVRTYTQRPDDVTPQFLEIKGRHNQLVYKHRMPLRFEDCPIEQRLLNLELSEPVASQFQFEYFKKQLAPVALIDYWRRPYISKYDPGFRLTFDEELTVTQSKELSPNKLSQSRSLVTGYTVMEVKFKRQFPSWFHGLIQAFELERVPLSKICKGMEALGLAQDL